MESKRDANFTRFVTLLRNVILQRKPAAAVWLIHFLGIHSFIKWIECSFSPGMCYTLGTQRLMRQGLCLHTDGGHRYSLST